MKIREIITELRSNPEQNIKKISGVAEAINFLQSKGEEIKQYGVSMTKLPKLGINPQSEHNTPMGIYFYPAEYYLKIKTSEKQLPYRDAEPYIQILEISGNIITLNQVTQEQFDAYVKALLNNVEKVSSLLGLDTQQATELIVNTAEGLQTEHAGFYKMINAPLSDYGDMLWSLFFLISKGNLSKENQAGIAKRRPVVWNALFRLVGIDGFIDPGHGLIHDNEYYQGVIINPAAGKLVKTIKNINPNTDTGKAWPKHRVKKMSKLAVNIPSEKPKEESYWREFYTVKVTFPGVDKVKYAKLYAKSNEDAIEATKNYFISAAGIAPSNVEIISLDYSDPEETY